MGTPGALSVQSAGSRKGWARRTGWGVTPVPLVPDPGVQVMGVQGGAWGGQEAVQVPPCFAA